MSPVSYVYKSIRHWAETVIYTLDNRRDMHFKMSLKQANEKRIQKSVNDGENG